MSKVTIDAIDRKILKFLIKNARMPFLEIARECGISGAAIHQRIKKLDESGVILGSRLMVDPRSLGFDVCAFIGIRLQDPTQNNTTVAQLRQIPEIVECHYVTGEYNLLIKLICTRNTAHRNEQTVRMAVNLAARSIVAVERVSHLERELLCYTYNTHCQSF